MTHDLLNDPVPLLLRKLALPTSVGFFFNTMFNVVDTFFGGLVSTQALAALSFAFPVFFLIIAVGAGVSSGATALIGHLLGAGEREEAERYAVQALSFGILHGLLLTLFGRLAAPDLFRLLGAGGEPLALAVAYMDVLFAGAVFFLVNYSCNSILNAAGDTRSFRNFLVTGFLLNLLLDPLFLFGGFGFPGLGLSGIGWSTVVVQACGNVYLMNRVRRTGLLKGLSARELIPRYRPYRDLARLGFPASLNMLTVALGIFVITWFISRYGKEAVAAYGIGTRIEQIALLPVMGMNIAVLSMVARNNGARRPDRVAATVATALKAGIALMLAGSAAVWVAAESLLRLFTRDEAVVAAGVGFLHVESLVFTAYVILYTCTSALQGLKRPLFALGIGIFRQFAVPVPVFYLFCCRIGWGITGIWWGIFVVTWTAAALALLFMRRTLHRLMEEGVAGG